MTAREPAGGLRVLAVDDEPPALSELVHLLKADPRISHVEGVSDATRALRYVHHALETGDSLDAVFLDLRMPGLNGLDVARILTRFARPPAIVFVTAYENHAVEAFQLKAVDYLLKPVRQERLAEAVQRVVDARGRVDEAVVPEATEAMELPADPRAESIPVELGGVTKFLKLSDVKYAEAQGDYARLYADSGSFLVRVPMSTLEERWAGAGFVRIHRSHIVSLKHVEEMRIDAGQMSVRVGSNLLTVSRRHARQVRDLLVRNARIKPNAEPKA